MVQFVDLWRGHPINESVTTPCIAPHDLTNMEGEHIPMGFPVGSQAADWVVAHQAFDSSDAAENLHMMVFVGCLMGGLIVGWLAGWVIAGAGGAKQTTS